MSGTAVFLEIIHESHVFRTDNIHDIKYVSSFSLQLLPQESLIQEGVNVRKSSCKLHVLFV